FSSRRRHTRSDRDRSSDVCSSDLASAADGAVGEKHDVVLAAPFGDVERLAEVRVEPVLHRLHLDDPPRTLDLVDRYVGEADVLEIGRASCRERGWDWGAAGRVKRR